MIVQTVSVSELRRRLSTILREVEAGAVFEVTRYGKIIAYLVPYSGLR